MKLPGKIAVRPINHDNMQHEFLIEVHVETESFYGGYSLLNPSEGYQSFSKSAYRVVEDQRKEA